MVRKEKLRIVYTSGTFDLFHIGHLNVLRRSKSLGDFLVVGVSTDELVSSYKKRKPIISFEDRREIIQHIDIVDQVIPQRALFDFESMRAYGVNVMTIGNDWEEKSHPNLDVVKESADIEVVFLPYTKSISTTEIKRAITNGWQDDV